MKKFFSFAVALVACAMVFTSCEVKIDSPLVGSWNHRSTLNLDGVEYDALTSIYFIDNGQVSYNTSKLEEVIHDNYITEGTWSVDGNKVTFYWQKQGVRHDGVASYDSSFKATTEVCPWEIKEVNGRKHLYLTRYQGTEKEFVEEFTSGEL